MSVEFSKRIGQKLFVEIVKPNCCSGWNIDVYNNPFDGYAKLGMVDCYGTFFPNGDSAQKPYQYFRHTDISTNTYRFGNIVDLGENYLSPQKGILFKGEIADKDTPIDGTYKKMSDEPLIYGFSSSEKKCEYIFKKDGLEVNEANHFKIKAFPWPIAIREHQSLYPNCSTFLQPSTFIGTLDNKPIMGLGSFDRQFLSQEIKTFEQVSMGYISCSGMGIREDGRREYLLISISLREDNKILVIYWLEGENPIITDKVSVDATWEHLPYCDDGTCIYKDAIFYFANKEIHFEGQWGSKGFTEKPRIEKHGQSQVFGRWYEGKQPYKHRLWYSINENMDAYDWKLKELGFNVID